MNGVADMRISAIQSLLVGGGEEQLLSIAAIDLFMNDAG
jgi:hypothetical protein